MHATHDQSDVAPALPQMSWQTVTPNLASMWLSFNAHNRTLRPETVEKYARDMAAGDWQLAGDPIRFNSAGELIDGQHRLSAVVASGVNVTFMVMRNMDAEARDVIDTGLKRTAADMMRLSDIPNSSVVAVTARLAIGWETGAITQAIQRLPGPYTHSELMAFVGDHPEILRVAADVKAWQGRGLRAAPSAVGMARWLTASIDREASDRFFDDLINMRTSGTGDPRFALLRRLDNKKNDKERISAVTQTFFFIMAWNAIRKGETLGRLQASSRHGVRKFPTPV